MNFLQKAPALLAAGLLVAGIANAAPVRTPEGNMPLVHWAVVESVPGKMPDILEIGARTLARIAAEEAGTYALYGGIDAANPDVMRLLEIYESNEAYRIHGSSEAFQAYRAERFPILKSLRILEVGAIALEQKASGMGTAVVMRRAEIAPEKLAAYQRLMADEAARAVREEAGVMGMFVTAEQAAPNIIHTMEIYADEAAREEYKKSKSYLALRENVRRMETSEKEILNLPAKIILTGKGLHLK